MAGTTGLDTMLNTLSGRIMSWIVPIILLSVAGWAFDAELRLKELELSRLEITRQQAHIEALESRVGQLSVIEERIQNIRDVLSDIRDDVNRQK